MAKLKLPIPVVDLFAGPGGLGEGFSATCDSNGARVFEVALSIEKDPFAYSTLLLRAFYRQFEQGNAPKAYYDYLKSDIDQSELFRLFPHEAKHARQQAWQAELGKTKRSDVDSRIEKALGRHKSSAWVLIGGPPCQAYSIVGRSRMKGADPAAFEKDPRHVLYREYLRILAVHKPPVFIMENVKGILSSQLKGKDVFSLICRDLCAPETLASRRKASHPALRYKLHSLTKGTELDLRRLRTSDCVIQSEHYGVPQTRHRVIILGIREDLTSFPNPLAKSAELVACGDAIGDLCKVRSGLSRELDSAKAWAEAVLSARKSTWLDDPSIDDALRRDILHASSQVDASSSMGGEFLSSIADPLYKREWFYDPKLSGTCNHSARLHMRTDLHRYLFSACFAIRHGRSPVLADFPEELLPNHRNVADAIREKTRLFSDRFRVQLKNLPATTVTSHLAKDGHYFIHWDPCQCRSLTVREAARLQTFPDNYFFEGPRTAQYQQVGNAVPPLLARAIAGIVHDVLLSKNGQ